MNTSKWISYNLQSVSPASSAKFVGECKIVAKSAEQADHELAHDKIESCRERGMEALESVRPSDRIRCQAAFSLLCDLAKQGWNIRLRAGKIEICKPDPEDDMELDRKRIQRQLVAERDQQLTVMPRSNSLHT